MDVSRPYWVLRQVVDVSRPYWVLRQVVDVRRPLRVLQQVVDVNRLSTDLINGLGLKTRRMLKKYQRAAWRLRLQHECGKSEARKDPLLSGTEDLGAFVVAVCRR